MTGKVVIVTGANSGIGYEVTRMLCEKGNDVIMACRNEEKANRAIEKIKRQIPNALATYMQLDLASLESVRKFVEDFRTTDKKLSILINNAGLSLGHKDTKRQYTKENFELVMGTNHLGHFLLTNLLLDDLKKTASDEGSDARIIIVTSSLHDPEMTKKKFPNVQPLDVENIFLFNDGTYNGFQAYKNSKLANIMFTYELCRRLENTGVKVNAICPGFVPTTEIMRNASNTQKFFSRYILHGMLRFTKSTRTVQQAAGAINSLALDEKYKEVTGKYLRDGQEVKSSEESVEEEKQKKLWQLSGSYVHLDGYEPIDVPPPPVEEEKKEEKKSEKAAAEVVEVNGEAAKGGESKKEEVEGGVEGKKENGEKINGVEKKEGEEKKEEKADEEVAEKAEKVEEVPVVKTEVAEEKAVEEKKEEVVEEKKEVEQVNGVKDEKEATESETKDHEKKENDDEAKEEKKENVEGSEKMDDTPSTEENK